MALKCSITFVLFTASAVWQVYKDTEVRNAVLNTFRDRSVFWRIGKSLIFNFGNFRYGYAPSNCLNVQMDE